MKKELIAQREPKSPISEIFRTLRTNIQFMNTNKKMKSLLITSTLPGEGKSWVTSNLAVTFAQTGKKVIIVDADMRKGRQYTIFGVSPKPGLSNYLSQVEIDENENVSEDVVDYIQETDVKNLYLMAAGNIPPNPSELLVSAQMIKLLDELKEICDIVIIDGTPCELVTDSIILSRIVDTTIIVTAHKSTKKDSLEKIVKNIQNVGGKIAGVVINKMPVSTKKYEQSYGYYGESHSKATSRNKKNLNKNKANDYIQKRQKKENVNPNLQRVEKILEVDKKEENIELPKAIINEQIKIEKKDETFEKTNDILKQINEYLDNEKRNLM